MEPQNSFDKRTLVAFVLMFAVLFGWSAIFGPKTPKDQGNQAPPGQESSTNTGAPAGGGEVGGTTPTAAHRPSPPAPAAAEPATQPAGLADSDSTETGPAGAPSFPRATSPEGQPILVETGLFRAEIDPVGGDIRSWELNQYQTVSGAPVQLITDRSLDGSTQHAHALRLLLPNGAVDLRRVQFSADRSSIHLDAQHPEQDLKLSARSRDGRTLELGYHFSNDHYGFDMTVRMVGGQPDTNPTAMEIRWPGGVANTEPDTLREYHEFKAVAQVGEEVHKKKFTDLQKGDGAKGRATYEGTVSWAGALSQYFAALVLLPDPGPGFVRLDGDAARHLQTFQMQIPLEPDDGVQTRYTVYLGPQDYGILSAYEKPPYKADLTRLIDLGPALFRPISAFTLAALKFLHKIIPNYGWVIILFSTFTKVLFYPLTKSSTESMKRMQLIQPQLAKLKEKYKDDQQKLSQEMFALYKKHGINPMAGCLPLLVQMPVFWALFTVLRRTIELRQAGFLGWMNDLSRPDVLFHLPFSLPILGDKFCVLPILMAVGMWAQTKLGQPAGGMGGEGAMAAQAKMMSTFMPIMMFVLFYNSPSGLVLYWLVNTILTTVQTWRIHQQMAPLAEPEAQPA